MWSLLKRNSIEQKIGSNIQERRFESLNAPKEKQEKLEQQLHVICFCGEKFLLLFSNLLDVCHEA